MKRLIQPPPPQLSLVFRDIPNPLPAVRAAFGEEIESAVVEVLARMIAGAVTPALKEGPRHD